MQVMRELEPGELEPLDGPILWICWICALGLTACAPALMAGYAYGAGNPERTWSFGRRICCYGNATMAQAPTGSVPVTEVIAAVSAPELIV